MVSGPYFIEIMNCLAFGAKSFVLFVAVGEWLLILSRHSSLTADFAQALWHIARASSSPMQPNTILTRSQLSMAESGFKPIMQWLDIRSNFEMQF